MKESVGLLPQNNTVYCSCQRGQRRGKQGPPLGTRGKEMLTKEVGRRAEGKRENGRWVCRRGDSAEDS